MSAENAPGFTFTGQIWALQNQDGNSTITLIDPKRHTVSEPLSYAHPSATSGYDDVVFKGDRVFLSYTNPNGAGDPTLVELVNGDHPSGLLKTRTILANGAIGLDTVTGKVEVVPQNDPDSLKLGPKGDLIFSSGAGGTIIDVANPGTAKQAVSFTSIADIPAASAGNVGLDDVIKHNAKAGTFYLTETATNKVVTFHATGLNPDDYYASVGALNAFGQVDPTTGAFTALLSANDAPGFIFGSPHGASFVADAGAPPAAPNVQAAISAFSDTGGVSQFSSELVGGHDHALDLAALLERFPLNLYHTRRRRRNLQLLRG